MKLSSKGRYGTRLLLDIALHQSEEPILLKDIASRQQLPLPYLERLIGPLIAGSIIRTTRGAKGGISLARTPDDIRMSEVIQLLEGPLTLAECTANPETCTRSASCVTRDVWSELKEAINGVLETTTLQDLVERQKNKEQRQSEMYYI